MAAGSKLGEVFVAIVGKDMGLKAALGQAQLDTETAAGRMTANIGNVAATMGKVFLALGAAAIIKKGIEGAEIWENRQQQLISALAQTGDATKENVKHVNDYAGSLAKLTIYSKGTIVEAMTQAKSLGVQTAQLDNVTKAAIGLAARYKMDLPEAMQMMALASQGNIRQLQRLMPVLKGAGTDAQKFALALKEGMDSFHYATAQASTTTGKFQQFQNALNRIITSIGIALLPILNVLVAVLTPIIELIGKLGEGFWKWVLGIAAGIAAVITIINVVGKLKKMWEGVTAAVSAAKAAMQDWKSVALALAAITAVTVAFAKADKNANDGLDEMLKNYQKTADEQQKAAEATIYAGQEAAREKEGKESESAAKKAEEEFAKKRDALKEQAQKILDVAKATREARQEEQERRREAIGWVGAEEQWKRAAVAGERQRYYQRPMGSGWIAHDIDNQPALPGNQFSSREMLDAVRKMNRESEIQTKYLAQAVRLLDPGFQEYMLNQ